MSAPVLVAYSLMLFLIGFSSGLIIAWVTLRRNRER